MFSFLKSSDYTCDILYHTHTHACTHTHTHACTRTHTHTHTHTRTHMHMHILLCMHPQVIKPKMGVPSNKIFICQQTQCESTVPPPAVLVPSCLHCSIEGFPVCVCTSASGGKQCVWCAADIRCLVSGGRREEGSVVDLFCFLLLCCWTIFSLRFCVF